MTSGLTTIPHRSLIPLREVPVIGAITFRSVLGAEMSISRIPDSVECSVAKFFMSRLVVGGDEPGPNVLALRHRLSGNVVIDPRVESQPDVRSRVESRVLQQSYWELEEACVVGYGPRVLDILGFLCVRLTDGAGKLRTGGMQVKNAHGGLPITLPSAVLARKQLELLRDLLCDTSSLSAIVQGARVMLGVLNAHPYTDGNGRLSRLLFNFILRRAGMRPGGYVPIYAAMLRSRGGFELSLREAEVFGRWDSLVRFLAQATMISAAKTDAQ